MPIAPLRAFADNAVDPHVRGFLHTPDTPNGAALVLTHGAGSNAQAPLLVSLAETFTAAGFTVLRCDLPYRQARSFGPPGPADAARDRAGLKHALEAVKMNMGAPLLADFARSGNPQQHVAASPLRRASLAQGRLLSHSLPQGGEFPQSDKNDPTGGPSLSRSLRQGWERKIFLGGHSYGGRQSSMLCAESPDLVAGLLLMSYPLHPPRRPEQQRTQHLPSLHTSTLFVHGTHDAFGTISEMERALKMIPARRKLLPVEGAGHDLGFKGKAKREELPQLIFSEFAKFFEPSS